MEGQSFDLKKYVTHLTTQEREQIIHELSRSGELTQRDIQWIMNKTVETNLPYYKSVIERSALLRFIWALFQDRPDYLARALAQAHPEVFYSDGVASRVVVKLHTYLGHTTKNWKGGAKGCSRHVVYMKDLPKAVRRNITNLYREARFLDFIYLMSRDPQMGFQVLKDEMAAATTEFERKALRGVRKYCQILLRMRFPGVIPDIEGRLFPSFHVRWWIERIRNVHRVLNVGGTSTHKTSFAVVGMHYYGCRKVLYICPAHARTEMAQKISAYFKNPRDKVFIIWGMGDLENAIRSAAEFTIVAYSTLIRRDANGEWVVVNALGRLPYDGLVLDECHYINHVDGSSPAQRAQACHTLREKLKPKRFMELSATPWENDPREMGETVSAIMPEVIPDAVSFRKWGIRNEQFLRELLAHRVLGIDLRDIADLPDIKPKPWENPFGVEKIPVGKHHQKLYDFVLHDTKKLDPMKKVGRLITAVVQPHLLRDAYKWPVGWEKRFKRWQLSSKLVWLRKYLTEAHQMRAKVAIGTGMYVEGITRTTLYKQDEIVWVGRLLQKWFGKKHVLILDGSVSPMAGKSRISPRDRIIEAWRTDPDAWILLISMRACPDSIDLTLKKMKGIRKLRLTAIGFGWKPWTQFRSRFYREGQAYPIEYKVPILKGTIDEDVLKLNEAKQESMERFLARSPITADTFFELLDKYEAARTSGLVLTA